MSEAIEFLRHMSFWYWLAFGLVLMLVELAVPGVVFLWLGLAAMATGLILLAVPGLGWELQLVAFAVLSVLSIAVGRPYYAKREGLTDHPTLNRRGDAFVGQQFTLRDATEAGHGRLQIGDTMWAVRVAPQGSDLAAGTRVTVVGVDGAMLVVEEMAPAAAGRTGGANA